MKNVRLKIILLSVFILLLIPALAMQFTTQVTWTASDFALAAILLLGTGLLSEFVMRKVTQVSYRVALCVGILTVFVLVWLELAVGIFGSPVAGS